MSDARTFCFCVSATLPFLSSEMDDNLVPWCWLGRGRDRGTGASRLAGTLAATPEAYHGRGWPSPHRGPLPWRRVEQGETLTARPPAAGETRHGVCMDSWIPEVARFERRSRDVEGGGEDARCARHIR